MGGDTYWLRRQEAPDGTLGRSRWARGRHGVVRACRLCVSGSWLSSGFPPRRLPPHEASSQLCSRVGRAAAEVLGHLGHRPTPEQMAAVREDEHTHWPGQGDTCTPGHLEARGLGPGEGLFETPTCCSSDGEMRPSAERPLSVHLASPAAWQPTPRPGGFKRQCFVSPYNSVGWLGHRAAPRGRTWGWRVQDGRAHVSGALLLAGCWPGCLISHPRDLFLFDRLI